MHVGRDRSDRVVPLTASRLRSMAIARSERHGGFLRVYLPDSCGNDFLSIKLNRVFLFFWQNTGHQLCCSSAYPGLGKMICRHKSMGRSTVAPFRSNGAARTKLHP